MSLSHGQIADAAAVWLSKPFSSLVVQELSTTSWGGSWNKPQYRMLDWQTAVEA